MPATATKEGDAQTVKTFKARLQEIAARASSPIKVDEENHVLLDVLLLGRSSVNQADYTDDAIQHGVHQYEEAQCYVGHSKDGSNPLYDSSLGVHRNVHPAPDGIRGNFHYNPEHRLAKQLVWDAKHNPRAVGFSHDADCTYHVRNGRKVVQSIDRVYSVDLVTKPGTTRGLFEDEQSAVESDPSLAHLAEGTLSAADNLRSILFAKDVPIDQRRGRLVEAVVQLHAELLEGEIADEIKADEKHRQLRKINETASDLMNRAMWNDEAWPTIAHKKDRCLAVLADWEREIKALSASAGTLKEEDTTMGFEFKDLTVEQIQKERPDLFAVLTKTDDKSRLTEEIAALKADAAKKDTELVALRAAEAKRLKEEEIAAELKAANFPTSDATLFSATFREQLTAAPNKESRAGLIADRLALASGRVQEQARMPDPMAEMRPADDSPLDTTASRYF